MHQVFKNFIVKVVFADQVFVNFRQKQTAFRALNNAVIVSRSQRNGFADAQLRKRRGGHRLIFRRIFDCAGRNNRALTGHQTRI